MKKLTSTAIVLGSTLVAVSALVAPLSPAAASSTDLNADQYSAALNSAILDYGKRTASIPLRLDATGTTAKGESVTKVGYYDPSGAYELTTQQGKKVTRVKCKALSAEGIQVCYQQNPGQTGWSAIATVVKWNPKTDGPWRPVTSELNASVRTDTAAESTIGGATTYGVTSKGRATTFALTSSKGKASYTSEHAFREADATATKTSTGDGNMTITIIKTPAMKIAFPKVETQPSLTGVEAATDSTLRTEANATAVALEQFYVGNTAYPTASEFAKIAPVVSKGNAVYVAYYGMNKKPAPAATAASYIICAYRGAGTTPLSVLYDSAAGGISTGYTRKSCTEAQALPAPAGTVKWVPGNASIKVTSKGATAVK